MHGLSLGLFRKVMVKPYIADHAVKCVAFPCTPCIGLQFAEVLMVQC